MTERSYGGGRTAGTSLGVGAECQRIVGDALQAQGRRVVGEGVGTHRFPAGRPFRGGREGAETMTTTIDKIAWIHLDDGRILSTRSRGKDVYYLPGGKRESGETDLETLAREIDEELAVAILPATARHLGTFEAQAHGHAGGVVVRMTCYTADHRGTPAPSREIEELAWLGYRDRDRVSPVDQVIFDHLHEAGRLR